MVPPPFDADSGRHTYIRGAEGGEGLGHKETQLARGSDIELDAWWKMFYSQQRVYNRGQALKLLAGRSLSLSFRYLW